MQVDFQFSIDQSVTTAFGAKGFIQMCAIDDGGVKYFVVTETNSVWLKESQISAA